MEKRGFSAFLCDCYPQFKMDQYSHPLVKLLDQYTARSKAFEKAGYSLEKGVCIIGAVGTGKTTLVRLLNYFRGLLSGGAYQWEEDKVWRLADRYQERGAKVFLRGKSKNMFFDELLLLDERTNRPVQEEVGYYSNKILAGEKLIRHRYEEFEEGYLTDFTTNATLDMIGSHYGERNLSRLKRMCNILVYVGNDRRDGTEVTRFGPPVFPSHVRQVREKSAEVYVKSLPEKNDEEVMKDLFNERYQEYLKGGRPELNWSHHLFFKRYAGDDFFPVSTIEGAILDTVRTQRKQRVEAYTEGAPKKNHRRMMDLKDQYKDGKLDEEERNLLFRQSYITAMFMYMEKKKKAGEAVLFK